MRTVISNRIYVYDAPLDLYFWCQDNLILVNPTYATMMRLGKEDTIARRHIPEKVKLYIESGSDLVLPFGCLNAIWKFIKNSPYEIRFNDNGNVIDTNMKITMPLFDYQEEAVEAMVKAKGGILEGACGCGKTQIGIEIAKRLGKNALWLCHTGDLLRQTVERIHKLYPCLSVGTITEGAINMVNDGITVSTIQTLVNIDPDIYAKKFDTVITDECFPAGTSILTNKGNKNIEDIKVGDYVLSYNHKTKQTEYKRVKHLFVKTSSMLNKICFNDKMLIATHNHPIYTQRGYVAAEDLKHGDYVLQSVWKTNNKRRNNSFKMESCKSKRIYLLQQGMCNQKQKEANMDCGNAFENGRKNDFAKFKSSSNEKKTFGDENKQSYEQFGNSSKNDRNQKKQWNFELADQKSWGKWPNCSMPTDVKYGASKNGFRDRNGICGCNTSENGSKEIISNMLQNRYSDSEFNDSNRSGRKFSLWRESQNERQKEKRILIWSRVESVQSYKQSNSSECTGSCTVYNFEVEDNNNYFANDILVHNCHHVSGSPTISKMHIKILNKVAARYKYGLSATLTRADTLIKSMYAYVGTNQEGAFSPVFTIKKDKTNTLIAKHIRINLNTPFSYDTLDESGMFNYPALVDFLGTNEERNLAIVNNVINVMPTHKKQLILCQRKEQCETINKMLQDRGIKSVLLMGNVTNKKRKEILGGSVDWNVIVATLSLAKEGLDVPELSCLHWGMVISDKVATIQSAGRIERVFEGKPEPEIYDYVDVNYPYCLGKYKKRVAFLKKR